MWANGLIFTNPPTDQVLVDTGPLSTGSYELDIAAQSSVQALLRLEHRDSANAATVNAMTIRLLSGEYLRRVRGLTLSPNERVRVILVTGITGTLEVDLFVVARRTDLL